jgi:hypothetical protein
MHYIHYITTVHNAGVALQYTETALGKNTGSEICIHDAEIKLHAFLNFP